MIYRGPSPRPHRAGRRRRIKSNLEKVPQELYRRRHGEHPEAVRARPRETIKEAGLHTIPWGTMGRADLMDEEMLIAPGRGLFSIKYGVETADRNLLNEIKKNISIDEVIAGIELTKSMRHQGAPDVHLRPAERHARDHRNDSARLPPAGGHGAVLHHHAVSRHGDAVSTKKNGWLLNENWEEYLGSHRAVARTANFTAEQLEDAVKQAYSRASGKSRRFAVCARRSLKPHCAPVCRRAPRCRPVLVTQSARPGLTPWC